jgi:hypothetical protein
MAGTEFYYIIPDYARIIEEAGINDPGTAHNNYSL